MHIIQIFVVECIQNILRCMQTGSKEHLDLLCSDCLPRIIFSLTSANLKPYSRDVVKKKSSYHFAALTHWTLSEALLKDMAASNMRSMTQWCPAQRCTRRHIPHSRHCEAPNPERKFLSKQEDFHEVFEVCTVAMWYQAIIPLFVNMAVLALVFRGHALPAH